MHIQPWRCGAEIYSLLLPHETDIRIGSLCFFFELDTLIKDNLVMVFDPLSIAGLSLGAASLTFQLFDGCIKGTLGRQWEGMIVKLRAI